jgi:DNA primase
MIDPTTIERIKEQIDCRDLIAHYLGKPIRGVDGSKAWSWRCPMHQESHGASLTAWRDGWKCWGACGTGGDCIGFLRVYSGLSFDDACHALGAPDQQIVTSGGHKFARREHHALPKIAEPPDDDWQGAARRVIREAQEILWSDRGAPALEYLRGRGLDRNTIKHAQLGYLPGHYTKYEHYRTLLGARFDVPYGILIPWIIMYRLQAAISAAVRSIGPMT